MLLAAALLALAQAPAVAAAPPQTRLAAPSRLLTLPEEALAYIPASAGPAPPLLVLLHGGGRRPGWLIGQLEAAADARGIVLLAPASRGATWDVIGLARAAAPDPFGFSDPDGGYRFTRTGDSDRVERAIAALGKSVPVERARTVLAGFSDGASFALALGMARAQPFAAVIAWSPGIPIRAAAPARGRQVLISHGRSDRVIAPEIECNAIVPLLESEGAEVSFFAFDGGHQLSPPLTTLFLDATFGTAVRRQSPAPQPNACHRFNQVINR